MCINSITRAVRHSCLCPDLWWSAYLSCEWEQPFSRVLPVRLFGQRWETALIQKAGCTSHTLNFLAHKEERPWSLCFNKTSETCNAHGATNLRFTVKRPLVTSVVAKRLLLPQKCICMCEMPGITPSFMPMKRSLNWMIPLGMMAYTFSPITLEAKAQGQPIYVISSRIARIHTETCFKNIFSELYSSLQGVFYTAFKNCLVLPHYSGYKYTS